MKKAWLAVVCFGVVGCVAGGAPETGRMSTCVTMPDDSARSGVAVMEGRLVESVAREDYEGELPPACQAISRVMEVEVEGGQRVVVGFGVMDVAGVDVTPEVELAPGAQVSVHVVREFLAWSNRDSFSVSDGEGLRLAMGYGELLGEEALGGARVVAGQDDGAPYDNSCETVQLQTLRVEGDRDVEIATGEQREVQIGGRPYRARAIFSARALDVSCLDYAGATSVWALWR